MYNVYFKQALELLKQNKFISTISIAGTALAIMMVMVLIVVDQVKNADISPEKNRSNLQYISYQSLTGKKYNSKSNNALDFETIQLLKTKIKSANKISASDGILMDYYDRTIHIENSKTRIKLDVRGTDTEYWDIHSFNFIEGKAFNEADFSSGLKKAVICKSIAEQFFGKKQAIGEKIIINNDIYTVIGIVKDISQVFKNAYAQIWIPYTSVTNYKSILNFEIVFLTESSKIGSLEKEIRAVEKEYNETNQNYEIQLFGPYNQRDSYINVWQFEMNKKVANRRLIFLFSILLLIPAINLSGLSLSRVKRRIEEIGIRKAFGAKRKVILAQILYENFITSLIGGLLGVILSFFTVSLMKEWLLGATDTTAIPLDALISLPVLIAVVVISFVLNLLSSGIPAWRAANANIVDSLNRKK